MSGWIVTHMAPWVLLGGLIVLVVGSAVLIQRYVRRRFPSLRGDEHNDVTRFTYGVIGFVYAFFMGFIVSSMWGQINTADANARSEGAAGIQMAMDLHAFDTTDADRIRESLLAYERAAIAEWAQTEGGRSSEVDRALAGVYTAYEGVHAKTDTQTRFLATSYTNLDKVSQARSERVMQARTDTGPPWSLWVVIFLTSGLVLGAAIVYGVEKSHMHYPMVVVVGVLVATNLALVLELAHPFIGNVSASPEPLREVVTMLTRPAG